MVTAAQSTEDRLAALEARMRAVEDELEILRLLNRYGPLVDGDAALDVAELWFAGGGYEFGTADGSVRVVAPDGLVDLYEGEVNRQLVTRGAAHLTLAPHIQLDGDTASAIGYSVVAVKSEQGWDIWRAAVNHWTLRRGPDGWRIQERTNRLLDGSSEPREVMRRVVN